MENINQFSRRNFLKGAGVALAGAGIAGLAGCASNASQAEADLAQTGVPGLPETWDYETDVLVVGFGIAGTGAASAAADAGARVMLIEKAPEDQAGGASRVNGGFITVSPEYSDVEYCYRNLKGIYDREVLAAHLEATPMLDEWLEDNDIEGLEPAAWPGYWGYSNPGGSWKYYPSLVNAVTSRGVEVLYSTPATELIQHPETGEIVGVKAERDGKPVAIKAEKGVILCTGSYGSNPEMVKQFNYPDVFIASYDSPFNTGDSIYMTAKVGAKLGGFFPESLEWEQYAYKVPSEEAGSGVMWHRPSIDAAHHIFVNRKGERFMNEYIDLTHTREQLPVFRWSEEMNDYLNSPFWLVVNEEMFNNVRLGEHTDKEEVYEDYGTAITMTWNGVFKFQPWSQDNKAELEKGWIVKGDTAEELAANMTATNFFGDTITVDPAGLKATIDEYNAACASGKDCFGRDAESLQPLGDGPYYAIEMCLASMYGYGGPVVDVNNNVVDVAGEPIKRLYAAGQVTLTFSPTSCNPTALISGLQSGKTAAEDSSWDGAAEKQA